MTLTLEFGEQPVDGVFRAEIRPNRSISPRNLAVTVICFAVLCLAIALSFLNLGLWLVLPFAGLEMVVVGLVAGYTIHRSRDWETIEIDATDVIVTSKEGNKIRSQSFARYWARVMLEPGADRLQPSRLRIGSHGRFVEIGRMITDSARKELAARLRHVLRMAA